MNAAAAPEMVAARLVLLDAVDALRPHHLQLTLIGAQAVYFRTGDAGLTTTAYTTDADVAVDPVELAVAPGIDGLLGDAGFARRRNRADQVMTGQWERSVSVNGREITSSVDLMVPEAASPRAGKRDARLPHHGVNTMRNAVGIEACLVDRTIETITSLEPHSERRTQLLVAGTAALLVAKLTKIRERLAQSATNPDRLVDKDASDVLRLLRTADAVTSATFGRLTEHETCGPITRQALTTLTTEFGRRGARGVAMAVRALPTEPPDLIETQTVGLAVALAMETDTGPR